MSAGGVAAASTGRQMETGMETDRMTELTQWSREKPERTKRGI